MVDQQAVTQPWRMVRSGPQEGAKDWGGGPGNKGRNEGSSSTPDGEGRFAVSTLALGWFPLKQPQ